MKKIKKSFLKVYSYFKKKCLNWYNEIKQLHILTKIIYFMILFSIVYMLIMYIWFRFVFIVLLLIFNFYVYFSNNKLLKSKYGNGVIEGNRRSGKGIIMGLFIRNEETEVYSNVPYGEKTIPLDLADYLNSIGKNTIDDFINGTVKIVDKKKYYEGKSVYIDDSAIYFNNLKDKELKLKYPSLTLVLAINGHLYGHFTTITAQNIERIYKGLRELQTDYVVRALRTSGFNARHKKTKKYKFSLYNAIPILRNYVSVKYRFYDEYNSALERVLPFNAKAMINEGIKHGYLTSGQALKEQFKAKYGNVFEGRIWVKKSNLNYDTRYFHELIFGYRSS